MTRIIRQALGLLTLVSALALTGCSAVKFGYEQLPSLLYWWLDSHVDFSNAQTTAVRPMLEQLQRWHRSSELPAYADMLGRMAQSATGAVDASQVCAYTRDIQQRMDRLAREAIRQSAPVVGQLDERQRTHLQRYWAERNRQWEEDWLQPTAVKLLQKRVESATDRYADFYGSLNAAQTEMVRRHILQSVWTPQWGLQERLRRQKDLLDALERIRAERLGTSQTEALLWGVWQRWLHPPGELDRARMQEWTEQGCRNLAELHNSTSPEQRAKASRRLRAYEKDLLELASRP